MMTLSAVARGLRNRALQYAQAPKTLAVYAKTTALISIGIVKPRARFNRILDDAARVEYRPVVKELRQLAPEIDKKKIARASIQQAFVFDTVRSFARSFENPRLLCVGSFEDTAAAALKATGFAVDEVDPVVNQLDLDAFFRLPTTRPATYEVVFSTSVIEHVKDDLTFVKQIEALLRPGGVAVLTCDFKEGYRPGDPLIGPDFRFYTKDDLSRRIMGSLPECELVDAPLWDAPRPDFKLAGFSYTFATLVFRKRSGSAARA